MSMEEEYGRGWRNKERAPLLGGVSLPECPQSCRHNPEQLPQPWLSSCLLPCSLTFSEMGCCPLFSFHSNIQIHGRRSGRARLCGFGRSQRGRAHTGAQAQRQHTLLPQALPWRDLPAIRRDISDIRVLIQPGFRWIGSSPPAVLRLPSAVSPHKEQRLYQILIPGDSASLGLIPRIRRNCKSAECRGMLSQFGNSCSAPAQQPWHWSAHRGCRR